MTIVIQGPICRGEESSLILDNILKTVYSSLSHSALGLWMYLYLNEEGTIIKMRPKEVTKELNISATSYYKSLKELQEKGFLIERKREPEVFDFYFYSI